MNDVGAPGTQAVAGGASALPPAAVTVLFKPSRDEWAAMIAHVMLPWARWRFRVWRWLAWTVPLAAVIAGSRGIASGQASDILLVVPHSVLAALLIGGAYFSFRDQVYTLVERVFIAAGTARHLVEADVTITAAGIQWQTADASASVSWRGISTAEMTTVHLVLAGHGGRFYLPLRAFGPGEAERAQAIARAGMLPMQRAG